MRLTCLDISYNLRKKPWSKLIVFGQKYDDVSFQPNGWELLLYAFAPMCRHSYTKQLSKVQLYTEVVQLYTRGSTAVYQR
jgi:hypothetical protein